jgi:hypothetical protein
VEWLRCLFLLSAVLPHVALQNHVRLLCTTLAEMPPYILKDLFLMQVRNIFLPLPVPAPLLVFMFHSSYVELLEKENEDKKKLVGNCDILLIHG